MIKWRGLKFRLGIWEEARNSGGTQEGDLWEDWTGWRGRDLGRRRQSWGQKGPCSNHSSSAVTCSAVHRASWLLLPHQWGQMVPEFKWGTWGASWMPLACPVPIREPALVSFLPPYLPPTLPPSFPLLFIQFISEIWKDSILYWEL